MMNKLLRHWAVYLTCLYLGFFVGLVSRPESGFRSMELNNLGDFLAGVVGPVALFWLVKGYFQQSKAISIQSRELRAAVDQHEAQVLATKQISLQEFRRARLDLYRLLTDTNSLLLQCQSKLGLREQWKSTLESMISVSAFSSLKKTLLEQYPFKTAEEISRIELRNDYSELYSKQKELDKTALSGEKMDESTLEECFREAVVRQGKLILLLERINDASRQFANASAKETVSTLDQHPL